MTMTDCLKWHKSINERGYGQVWIKGKRFKAHRAAWIAIHGEIPAGFVIDHKCHNEAAAAGLCSGGVTCEHRACVNVEHLQLATTSQNILAGMHSIDIKASCPKGHSYRNENNVMVRKSGKRECAACNRVRANAAYARKLVGA